MKKIWLLAICLGISSLAAAQSAKERKQNIREAESACGDPRADFFVGQSQDSPASPPIESGKARVYIIEEDQHQSDLSNSMTFVGMDGKWIGATTGNSYITFSVDPGKHHLCAQFHLSYAGRVTSLSELTATANQTYYFRATVFRGYNFNIFNLEPVYPDEGKLMMTESAPAVFTETWKKKKIHGKRNP